MKTANARIVPYGVIGNEPLTGEMETQGFPRMKTIKEMVEPTGLSYTTLRNLCLENKIVHIRAGKK